MQIIKRAEYEQLCTQLLHLSLAIGLRAACRSLGISEDRGRKISSRRNWQLSELSPLSNDSVSRSVAASHQKVTIAREIHSKIMSGMEKRSQLAMARTGMRAFEHADTLTDEQLHERDRAIALQNHGKNLQLAHSWFPNVQSNVNVNVANIPLPSAEERAELTAIDRKLDAIAAKLKAAANRPQLEA